MKMQLKRIVSAVCAVALCASVVSTPVLAAGGDGTSVPGTTQSESSAPEETTEETTASEETNVENKQPADTVAEQPANDQEQPANDQEQPANDQEQPANNVQESADNVQEQPVDNEAGPAAPSNDGAATPSVMSYNGESQEVHVNDTTNVTLTAQWKEQGPGPIIPSGNVKVGKKADPLDAELQSDVTLTIGASESKDKVAVLFLLDKSTSQGMRKEAAEMLWELKTKDKVDILYDVVIFSGTATATGWKNIQDSESLEDTLENFVNGETSSGTNMDAGIERALSEMNALQEDYKNAATYLVTLSDGITYVWSEGGNVKCVPVRTLGASGTIEGTVQNASDTWDMMYDYGMGLQDIYNGSTISEIIANFKDAVVSKMNATREDDHIQSYPDSYENPISTYIYDLDMKAEVADTYACGPDFAMYESVTGYEQLVELFDYSFAYAVPELDGSGNDKMSNWENYPWGKEIMLYMHSLSTDANESGKVSNADAKKMFSSIKNRILYAIEKGTVTDVIGKDFDLAGVNTFKLKVGDEAWVEGTVSNDDPNKVTFEDGKYVVTYTPADGTTEEQFVWTINTPVQNIAPLQLTYKVKLVNVPTEIGEYKLPTNEEATLDYTSTNDGTGSEEFPKPEVTYNVVGVTPASLTIYMGGSSGYGNIVGEDGQTLSNTVSLPEPGFYLELTEDMNNELREVLGKKPTDIIDLSGYVTLTNGETTWNLQRYGYVDGTEADEETSAGYIEGESRFIYKIVPEDGSQGAQVRVKVTKDNETKTDDEFDISETQSLCEEYDMEIYGEDVDAADLKLSINIPAADRKGDNNNTPYTATAGLAAGKPATLTVRYVTGQQEDVVTDALNDIGEAKDPSKAYVVLKDLNKEPAEDFIINQAVNGLTVQADPDSVALLFDDIVSSDDTNDEDTHFEQTLVENAVKATNQSFQNLQYQAKYLDLVDANNGNTWLTTNDEVTVYWPYPEGTNASTKFYLQHFEGIDRDDTLSAITGEVKNATPDDVMVHTGDNGIYFETKSFSPYVLMWDKTTPAVDDGGKEESTPAATPKPTPAPAEEAQPVAAPVAAVIPQTGDDSQPLVWVALVVVSGAALAGLAVYRKKRSDK